MNILIVDDEKELADFLRSSFEGEGFSVDVAYDGVTGLEYAIKNKYDIIILDNILPKKEGKQVCREIRKEGNHVPIIMLSVNSEIDTKVELLNMGADDYISKPFSFEELLARIRAVTRRPEKIESKLYRLGDLVLDDTNKTVKCKSKNVYLTCKEFSILACLLKNKRSIISREKIMEYVWDENVDHFSNALESHIVNIRKKIKCGGKKCHIQSVTGRGYRIGVEE